MRLRITVGLLSLLLGACGAASQHPVVDPLDEGAIEPSAGPPRETSGDFAPSAWPAVRSCPGLVRGLVAMDVASAGRLDVTTAPLALASVAPRAAALHADLPIPQVPAADLDGYACGLIVGAATALPAGPDKILDERTVHSAYPTGTNRRRNPEHQRLERELAAARRGGAGDADIMRTGEPLLDLMGTVAGGIIGGIGAASTRRKVDTLEHELEATPAFLDEPILTPYHYALTEIEAERRVALPLAMHDRAAGLAWRTVVTLGERRRFAVAGGRHDADVAPLATAGATLTTPAGLAAWRQAAPVPTTRTILTHLGAADAAAPASLEATVAALHAPPDGTPAVWSAGDATATGLRVAAAVIPGPPEPAAGPDRAGELELLAVGADGLAGFHVTSEHIVAPATALGRSSLVAVRYPDGLRAHGLVELVDDDLGLALVFVPRQGTPLPRSTSPGPPPGSAGAPGEPWASDGEISGLFVGDPATGTLRWVDAPTLDRFVARLDAP